MANFNNEQDRKNFGSFIKEHMQLKHKTIEDFSSDLSMEPKTLRSYLDGSFPANKLSNVYRLLETLNVEFGDFEMFLDKQTSNSENANNFTGASGATININEGNSFTGSPIGTQGSIVIHNHSDKE